MNSKNTQYRIRQCSMCPEETNYLCSSCTFDTCSQCRQRHWFNLLTIDHDVVTYREKFNYIHRLEVCAQHRNKHYRKYCEACNLPVCNHCTAHKMHKQINLRAEYDTKRQQHRGDIYIIRNNAQSRYKQLSKGIFFISIRSVKKGTSTN